MTDHMLDFMRSLVWYADICGPVLEIGSYVEANQDHLDMRRAFPRGTPYLGIDTHEGPGVDRVADLMNSTQIDHLLAEHRPKVVLCLYVIEHVWVIHQAVKALADIWHRDRESWMFVGTHQNQPYHATEKYPDFWRITASGMKRIFDEANLPGANVIVFPDSSNPTDVLMVQQPGSMAWPEETFDKVRRATSPHWKKYC